VPQKGEGRPTTQGFGVRLSGCTRSAVPIDVCMPAAPPLVSGEGGVPVADRLKAMSDRARYTNIPLQSCVWSDQRVVPWAAQQEG
jgi:hypothetical protein